MNIRNNKLIPVKRKRSRGGYRVAGIIYSNAITKNKARLLADEINSVIRNLELVGIVNMKVVLDPRAPGDDL